MALINRGTIRVWSNRVIGIDYLDVDAAYAIFGDNLGTVTLHLEGGGRIEFNIENPKEEAQQWAIALGWENP